MRWRTVILRIAAAAAIVLSDPLPPPVAFPEDIRRELDEARRLIERLQGDLERAEFSRRAFTRFPSGEARRPEQATKVTAADNAANVVVIGLGSEEGVQVGYRWTSRGARSDSGTTPRAGRRRIL